MAMPLSLPVALQGTFIESENCEKIALSAQEKSTRTLVVNRLWHKKINIIFDPSLTIHFNKF